MVEHDAAAAELARGRIGMGDEQDRDVFVHHDLADALDALALEGDVAHR